MLGLAIWLYLADEIWIEVSVVALNQGMKNNVCFHSFLLYFFHWHKQKCPRWPTNPIRMIAMYNRPGSNQPQKLETQNWCCECKLFSHCWVVVTTTIYHLYTYHSYFLVQTPKKCICIYYACMDVCMYICMHMYTQKCVWDQWWI